MRERDDKLRPFEIKDRHRADDDARARVCVCVGGRPLAGRHMHMNRTLTHTNAAGRAQAGDGPWRRGAGAAVKTENKVLTALSTLHATTTAPGEGDFC